ncbi:hypothetical protein ABW21_db0203343 [Orbilia brochopaga]|nr:hypothetical protein ABW21_db0203343 [Drechslerella brochopaga]
MPTPKTHRPAYFGWPDVELRELWADTRAELIKLDQALIATLKTIGSREERLKEVKAEWLKDVAEGRHRVESIRFEAGKFLMRTISAYEKVVIATQENYARQNFQRAEILKFERLSRLKGFKQHEEVEKAFKDITDFYEIVGKAHDSVIKKQRAVNALIEWLNKELHAAGSGGQQ